MKKKDRSQKNKDSIAGSKRLVFLIVFTFFTVLGTQAVSAQVYHASASVENSIQAALDQAKPGDIIQLEPGIYYQDFDTKTDGTPGAPITITGPFDAVIKGSGREGRSRIAQIFHDYYHLEGFTFDGLAGNSNEKKSYRDILLYVQGTEKQKGVTGLKVLNMRFKNSGGEAVRIRYFSYSNEIAYSRFENAGTYGFRFDGGGKNGESIYIGTSSQQWKDGKNPTPDPDASNYNWIHNNYFNTNGNEAVDIKEGAMYNIVENNIITNQKDPESGCLDSRGDENIFRFNIIYGCSGAGVRLGGHKVDGHQYGVNNQVYGNKIYNNKNGGIKFEVSPQGKVCGNKMINNIGGDSVGSYYLKFNPVEKCGFIEERFKKIISRFLFFELRL